MNFERRTMDAQHYVYAERECAYDGEEIAAAMGSAFGEIYAFVTEAGIERLSRRMSIYLSMSPDMLRFRGAMAVSEADAAKATGSVKSDVLPAGDAITTTHVGAYATLNQTHRALWQYMEENDLPGAFPIWEVYADDPGEVAEADLRTQIFRMIA